MAQNIWNATLDVDNNVKQNPFDWNHVNNLTTQIGRLTPVFCDLVPAKTSFRVNPKFALQLMPMVFPIQTRMRASISFFRYPLRALWKDYKDYVGNFRQGLEEPYVNINTENRLQRMVGTGSLGDYLGVPSTLVGSFGLVQHPTSGMYPYHTVNTVDSINRGSVVTLSSDWVNPAQQPTQSNVVYASPLKVVIGSTYNVTFGLYYNDVIDQADLDTMLSITYKIALASTGSSHVVYDVVKLNPSSIVVSHPTSATTLIQYTASFVPDMTYSTDVVALLIASSGQAGLTWDTLSTSLDTNLTKTNTSLILVDSSTIKEITLESSPYYNSLSVHKDEQIKLSAYAFRAYEGIYNSMYRDNRNNPYYIDGVVQYNQWIPSYEGGEDNNLYELRYANWEKDFLTTSVQSPQQGQAPLVGITTYQTTVAAADGTSQDVTKVALVDESGQRYGIEFQGDDTGLQSVNYVELDNGTVVRQARNLMDLATSGISIPDLRMVNCYQKFLELNMRKGYSYKEIVEGRFDVKVRYADLLLPEFFGGFSRDMNMNAISQTVDQDTTSAGTYKDALGSQAGVGYFYGDTNRSIECFCDEESIIMGILVVTPLPVYTQLLPKHFTYRNLLDHFNPEFNNIGFQPITYKEVAPIQSYNFNPSSLNDTFGYQRPWYEYCQRYDTAHGLFRTQLSNFLMHRVFNVRPELAQSFLVIDPEQVTDVFSVTETTDKIYGQVAFDITCKLPVARVAIPRLD
nr:MAG: major capsid protein [Microviridae sp.]UCS96118.1 MAG: major capsid protein [Microviridae sp.]